MIISWNENPLRTTVILNDTDRKCLLHSIQAHDYIM